MLRRALAGIVLLPMLLVACDGSDGGDGNADLPLRIPASPTTSSGPVIGLVGTMSGEEGWRGSHAYEGVHVAIQVLNRKRADAEPFSLVGSDDGGDAERALELIEELAGSERTVGIIYAGPPEGMARAEGVLAEAGIPALMVYDDLYSARLLRPHLFQVSPPLLWQARRLASYLLEDRRYERVGVLVEDTLMGETASSSMRSAMADEDDRPVVALTYPKGDEDLTEELERLRDRDVEAIVFHGTPKAGEVLFDELAAMGSTYRDTDSARTSSASKKLLKQRRKRGTANEWRPHVAAFDLMMGPAVGDEAPPGTVIAETYSRGAFYLPVPDFEEFHKNFVAWWDDEPLGWQRRAYEATLLVGWAVGRSGPDDDIAERLEELRSERFGGIDVTFGPDDHTSVFQTTVGLWVVPRDGIEVRERERLPSTMPWVPLSRGFSIDGNRTMVLPQDWEALFKGEYRVDGPAPTVGRARFGVATPRQDPVH